jgi:hypothetical protein
VKTTTEAFTFFLKKTAVPTGGKVTFLFLWFLRGFLAKMSLAPNP